MVWVVPDHHVGVGDGDLERRDVKRGHVILAAALVLVINDILPNVVVGVRVFDLSFPTTVVYNEHKD